VPQLYVNGEFVGGSDIMTEMYESGELAALLKKNG
jgi:monothiol glutaredoxin